MFSLPVLSWFFSLSYLILKKEEEEEETKRNKNDGHKANAAFRLD